MGGSLIRVGRWATPFLESLELPARPAGPVLKSSNPQVLGEPGGAERVWKEIGSAGIRVCLGSQTSEGLSRSRNRTPTQGGTVVLTTGFDGI